MKRSLLCSAFLSLLSLFLLSPVMSKCQSNMPFQLFSVFISPLWSLVKTSQDESRQAQTSPLLSVVFQFFSFLPAQPLETEFPVLFSNLLSVKQDFKTWFWPLIGKIMLDVKDFRARLASAFCSKWQCCLRRGGRLSKSIIRKVVRDWLGSIKPIILHKCSWIHQFLNRGNRKMLCFSLKEVWNTKLSNSHGAPC